MFVFSEAFEGQDFAGFTVVGGPTIDTVSPLHGSAMEFACGGVNYIEKAMPYLEYILYQGMWMCYSNTTSANGIVEWIDNLGVSSGDLRFNPQGRLELRVGGTLMATGARIYVPMNPYHLQFWLSLSPIVGRVEVRINDSPLPDLTYFGNTKGGTGEFVSSIRYGSFGGTGTGTGWLDDLKLNDGNAFGQLYSADAQWPGMVAWVASEPNDVGSEDDWDKDPVVAANLNVDDVPNDGDDTFITTDRNGDRQGFKFPPMTGFAGSVLEAVKYEVVLKGTTADQPGIVRIGFKAPAPYATEVLTVTLTSVTSPWQLAVDNLSTAELPPGATAAQVQASLRAAPMIHPDGVTVTGSAGGPYTLTFGGHLTNTAMPAITGGSGTGTIAVTKPTPGAGIKYGSVPFGQNPIDLTDTYMETLTGADYVKHSARRNRDLSGVNWTLETANDSEVVLISQGLNNT